MFAQAFGTCTFGLNGHVITVEVDISRASPAFDIVGLPAVSVKESKERYGIPDIFFLSKR